MFERLEVEYGEERLDRAACIRRYVSCQRDPRGPVYRPVRPGSVSSDDMAQERPRAKTASANGDDRQIDVLIAGGGQVGLTLALALRRAAPGACR